MNARIGDRLWIAAWAVLLATVLSVAAAVGLLFWAREALGRGPEPRTRGEKGELLKARSPH